MKALKGSLVALVAILAVGLTVAMQAGAFESKAPLRVADCFPTATIANASCVQVAVNDGLACSPVPSILNRPIFSLSTAPIDPVTDCPTGAKLCCIKIVTGTQLCNQPQIDLDGTGPLPAQYYRVSSIECKP